MDSDSTGSSSGKGYSLKEKKAIVDYVVSKHAFTEVKGRAFWKACEDSRITNRTWQSLKEVYLKRIIPDIDNPYYKLSPKNISNFRRGIFALKLNTLKWVDKQANEENTKPEDSQREHEREVAQAQVHNTKEGREELEAASEPQHCGKESQVIPETAEQVNEVPSPMVNGDTRANCDPNSSNDGSMQVYGVLHLQVPSSPEVMADTEMDAAVSYQMARPLQTSSPVVENSQQPDFPLPSSLESEQPVSKDILFSGDNNSNKKVIFLYSENENNGTKTNVPKEIRHDTTKLFGMSNGKTNVILKQSDCTQQCRQVNGNNFNEPEDIVPQKPSTCTEIESSSSSDCDNDKPRSRPTFALYKGELLPLYYGPSGSSLKHSMGTKRKLYIRSPERENNVETLSKVNRCNQCPKQYFRQSTRWQPGSSTCLQSQPDRHLNQQGRRHPIEHKRHTAVLDFPNDEIEMRYYRDIERYYENGRIGSKPVKECYQRILTEQERKKHKKYAHLYREEEKKRKAKSIYMNDDDSEDNSDDVPKTFSQKTLKITDISDEPSRQSIWKIKYKLEKKRNDDICRFLSDKDHLITPMIKESTDLALLPSAAEKNNKAADRKFWDSNKSKEKNGGTGADVLQTDSGINSKAELFQTLKSTNCKITVSKHGQEVLNNILIIDTQKADMFMELLKSLPGNTAAAPATRARSPSSESSDDSVLNIRNKENAIFDAIIADKNANDPNLINRDNLFTSSEVALVKQTNKDNNSASKIVVSTVDQKGKNDKEPLKPSPNGEAQSPTRRSLRSQEQVLEETKKVMVEKKLGEEVKETKENNETAVEQGRVKTRSCTKNGPLSDADRLASLKLDAIPPVNTQVSSTDDKTPDTRNKKEDLQLNIKSSPRVSRLRTSTANITPDSQVLPSMKRHSRLKLNKKQTQTGLKRLGKHFVERKNINLPNSIKYSSIRDHESETKKNNLENKISADVQSSSPTLLTGKQTARSPTRVRRITQHDENTNGKAHTSTVIQSVPGKPVPIDNKLSRASQSQFQSLIPTAVQPNDSNKENNDGYASDKSTGVGVGSFDSFMNHLKNNYHNTSTQNTVSNSMRRDLETNPQQSSDESQEIPLQSFLFEYLKTSAKNKNIKNNENSKLINSYVKGDADSKQVEVNEDWSTVPLLERDINYYTGSVIKESFNTKDTRKNKDSVEELFQDSMSSIVSELTVKEGVEFQDKDPVINCEKTKIACSSMSCPSLSVNGQKTQLFYNADLKQSSHKELEYIIPAIDPMHLNETNNSEKVKVAYSGCLKIDSLRNDDVPVYNEHLELVYMDSCVHNMAEDSLNMLSDKDSLQASEHQPRLQLCQSPNSSEFKHLMTEDDCSS